MKSRLTQIIIFIAVFLGIIWLADYAHHHLDAPIASSTLSADHETIQHILPDSSIIILTKGGKAVFPSDMSKGTRSVRISGDARVHIKDVMDKPFYIYIGQMVLRTQRGIIDLQTNGNRIYIYPQNGQIECIEKDAPEKIIMIREGEKISFKTS